MVFSHFSSTQTTSLAFPIRFGLLLCLFLLVCVGGFWSNFCFIAKFGWIGIYEWGWFYGFWCGMISICVFDAKDWLFFPVWEKWWILWVNGAFAMWNVVLHWYLSLIFCQNKNTQIGILSDFEPNSTKARSLWAQFKWDFKTRLEFETSSSLYMSYSSWIQTCNTRLGLTTTLFIHINGFKEIFFCKELRTK